MNGGDAYASKHANLWRGDAYLSAFEAIQIIIDFDLYTIELIALVVKLDKNDKKKYLSFNFSRLDSYSQLKPAYRLKRFYWEHV